MTWEKIHGKYSMQRNKQCLSNWKIISTGATLANSFQCMNIGPGNIVSLISTHCYSQCNVCPRISGWYPTAVLLGVALLGGPGTLLTVRRTVRSNELDSCNGLNIFSLPSVLAELLRDYVCLRRFLALVTRKQLTERVSVLLSVWLTVARVRVRPFP